jgi:tetratricopeptide (TPR) repeat protein
LAATRSEKAWLDEARIQILHGQLPAAQATLDKAMAEYPASTELRRVQAGIFRQTGHDTEAEVILRKLLVLDTGDAASAFALARILKEQARTAAAAAVLRTCLARNRHRSAPDIAIQGIELLDDCDRKRDAVDIAEAAIAGNPDDARLHAYAGMLEIQLGNFESAREHYLFALRHDDRAWEWHCAIGLSSTLRYRDSAHADLALFQCGLRRDGLSDMARAELHFASGKAHDDIGEYGEAARHFRAGNAIAHRLTRWSRKAWRRATEARLAAAPFARFAEPTADFNPIFIVGMPRSGTTLLAELLSRHPGVCNRGELPWIARLAMQPGLTGLPEQHALQRAASTYAMQTRRDDAVDVRWFIDKQALNFRYVDLILALFPDARVIHCQRAARDTALSLWMQYFLDDANGYAYDFDDIWLVMRTCDQLMARWHRRFPDSIRSIRYEDIISDPDHTIADLAKWIGLTSATTGNSAPAASVISTASLWQARQPVHTRSVKRAESYLALIPELAR